jgi:hypothetical protein
MVPARHGNENNQAGYITYPSRKQMSESIVAAVKETVERARALAAAPSSGVAVAPLSLIDDDLKVEVHLAETLDRKRRTTRWRDTSRRWWT